MCKIGHIPSLALPCTVTSDKLSAPLRPVTSVRPTLLIPELIWPEPGDELTLGKLATPGLDWLLAHADAARGARQGYEAALLEAGGLAGQPFGALRLLGEADGGIARDGHWLCADPVHLRFHHERIVLADAGAFDLDESDAQALVAALNAEFAELGHFHASTAKRWYLRLHAAVDHVAEPISAVAGRRMNSELDGKASPLRRWLNEIQMFLHVHPVNAKRQAAGLPAVNSLWLWGGGELPATNARHSAVCADDPLARGLALAAGLPARPMPASLAGLLAGPASLVVLDALLPPVLYEDGAAWRAAAEELDRDWFAPLRRALGRGIDGVELVAPTIYGTLSWSIAAGERWKFWKKGRPLADRARELAEGKMP